MLTILNAFFLRSYAVKGLWDLDTTQRKTGKKLTEFPNKL